MIVPAYAAEGGSCGENLTWTLSGDVLTISGSGDMMEYSDGSFPGWYGDREKIRTIILPSGLTSVSDFAFFGCENATSIVIPSAVTTIGDYSFAKCTGLLQVDLGTGVKSIGEGAFQECESLTGISFPPSLTSLGFKAFYRCYSIQSLTVPITVTNMESSVFAYCTGLVRATVNAQLKELPDWTFYGCTSLTDVSLASSLISLGDYAFQNCENLNGIYTQEGSVDTAYSLENSIPEEEGAPSKGVVGIFEMPETSVTTTDDGSVFREKKIAQVGDTVIAVTKETDYSGKKSIESIIIAAAINQSEDWENVALIAEETLGNTSITPITIKIQLVGNTVSADSLALFAGKSIIIEITTSEGIIWKIDMSQMTEKSFSGKYDFYVGISEIDSEETEIESNSVFQINFADYIDFYAEVGIPTGTAKSYATLYQKSGRKYEIINTIVVDSNNIAWFSLANTDKSIDYFVGINVEGINLEAAVVPDTMLEQYDLENDDATLMDKDGTRYRITGRTSKWGITSSQFMSYVLVAMIAVILIVAVVMISMNIVKRSREKYADMAKEDDSEKAIDEEELRMEIMKELLGENSNKE